MVSLGDLPATRLCSLRFGSATYVSLPLLLSLDVLCIVPGISILSMNCMLFDFHARS